MDGSNWTKVTPPEKSKTEALRVATNALGRLRVEYGIAFLDLEASLSRLLVSAINDLANLAGKV